MKIYLVIVLSCVISNVAGQHPFEYDQQGRLVSDPVEEIAMIEWNNFNKITRIVRTSGSNKPDLEFSYDALGNRIRKIVKPKEQGKILPVNKWEYFYYQNKNGDATMAIYHSNFQKTSSSNYTQFLGKHYQQLLSATTIGIEYGDERDEIQRKFNAQINAQGYFESIEENGVLIPELAMSASTTKSMKRYELINHERNINVVISDRAIIQYDDNNVAEVVSASDHYPFGMKMPQRIKESTSTTYAFGFSGKEKQMEVSSSGDVYDYGARMYEARLGRWLSMDALVRKFPSVTPYAYSDNSPISLIDMNGDEPEPSFHFKMLYGSYYSSLLKTPGYQFILEHYGNKKYTLEVDDSEIDNVNKKRGVNFLAFTRSTYKRPISEGKLKRTKSVFPMQTLQQERLVIDGENRGVFEVHTYSHVFIVTMIIHEGIHAISNLESSAGDEDHSNFNKKHALLFETLRQYARQQNLKFTDEQLEDISWWQTSDSPQFKEFIKARAARNKTNYATEENAWRNSVQGMMFDTTQTDVPLTPEELKNAAIEKAILRTVPALHLRR